MTGAVSDGRRSWTAEVEVIPDTTAPDSVRILESARSPKSFWCLLQSPLESCRKALRATGRSVELPSGAKMFVHAQQAELVIECLGAQGWDLKPRHVIVDKDFEDVVLQAVKAIPSREGVRPKSRRECLLLYRS